LLLQSNGDPLATIVKSIFPDLLQNMNDLSFSQDGAILAPKNTIVDEVNDYMLNLLLGEEKYI